MKKITLLALIAMMLIGMLAFTACKAKVQPAGETNITIEQTIPAADDTMTVGDKVVEGVQEIKENIQDLGD
ncbi:MAG: hypothetical protein K0B87_03670 [Candidatus Syntrophosphaera sp.]|nr:hypothetical protein [Candidatus Syntrophosphaera sp.]